MTLVPWRVPPRAESLIEKVRLIYNENLPLLATKPLTPVTKEQQRKWWAGVDHDKVKLYVYMDPDDVWSDIVVGFSLLTDRGSYVTPMMAVTEKYHDRGYGQEIMLHYLQTAHPKPLRAQSLMLNLGICMLNSLMGWKVIGSQDGVYDLWHENGSGHDFQP